MKTIIHLSDLHIGRRDKEEKRTNKVFREIANSYAGMPVLITGDLTDKASLTQFMQTRSLLDDLAKSNPILAVPGNHDYAWKGIIWREDAWKDWVFYLGKPLGWGTRSQSWGRDESWLDENHKPIGVDGLGIWEHGSCVFFGIDSGDPANEVRTARGWISQKLADGLKKSLRQYAGKTRIAFLHHHPFVHCNSLKLVGSDRLLVALKNNCELVLFGHKHDYGIWWNTRGVPLIVSSHKTANLVSGDCLMIALIDVNKPGSADVSFNHRLKVVQM